MADTSIEWVRPMRADGSLIEGYTANLWWGCEQVENHPGCEDCYAKAWSRRYETAGPLWDTDSPRKEVKSIWSNLTSWQRKAADFREMHRVFVGSMMDICELSHLVVDYNGKPLINPVTDRQFTTEDFRKRFFQDYVPFSPNLLFLFLSKRVSLYNRTIPIEWIMQPPPNVMFGTSVSDQKTYDTYKRHLLRVNGQRFLSVEPQTGPINLYDLRGIDWVIQGGLSGSKRYPFNLDWAYRMRDQCARQGVPYFFKQIDKIQEIPADLMVREFPPIFQNHEAYLSYRNGWNHH